MSSSDTVSAIALAVALVALITTISQVLGQFLATADGYRRCQPSVMGGWAKLTRRRFRWSELRFETIYTTPKFGLSSYPPGYPLTTTINAQGNEIPHLTLDGSPLSLEASHCKLFNNIHSTELASWVKLIEAIHATSREMLRLTGNTTEEQAGTAGIRTPEKEVGQSIGPSDFSLPSITVQERSWDFVPPEVVRPVALVGMSDIAIIARRLGMVWKQFEPLDGNFRAEGNGHTIFSTAVRSIGTVLQIGIKHPVLNPFNQNDIEELYVASEEADKMGFGIVPGEHSLGVPDYKIGTEDEVLALLRDVIDPTLEAMNQVKSIMNAHSGCTPGVSDIIGLAAPMIRQPHSSVVDVPAPADYILGLTQQETGFVVFHNRLRDLVNDRDAKGVIVRAQTRLILEQYEDLLLRYGSQWEDQHVGDRTLNTRSVTFLDDLHARHTATIKYFKDLSPRYDTKSETSPTFSYTNLMYSHIRHAVRYISEASERLNSNPSQDRDHYGLPAAGPITEGAHIYFDNIHKIIEDMRRLGFDKPGIVEEAWLTMMFKAFLWHRCHFMVKAPRVPSTYWGSTFPVYIG